MARAPGRVPSGLEVAGNLVILLAVLVGAIAVGIGVLGLVGVQQVSLQSRSASGANWGDTGLRTVLFGLAAAAVIAVPGLLLRWLGRRRA